MAIRGYWRYSPIGIDFTTSLNANDTYLVDFGPTLGMKLIKGSDATDILTKREVGLHNGDAGTRPAVPPQ